MGAFGFSTEGSQGGDYLPIVKYDARAGRLFRIDRVNTGNGFESSPADITQVFRALIDFDNIETGWIDFQAGSAPSFVMIKLEDLDTGRAQFPEKPGPKFKSGIRVMIKLAKEIAGESQIREWAGTARSFLQGIEDVYIDYKAARQDHPGKVPVIAFNGLPTPIKTGSGDKTSTNYRPHFRILDWADRGDLRPVPRGQATGNTVAPQGNGQRDYGAPPNTGAANRQAPPPRGPAQPHQAPPQQQGYQQRPQQQPPQQPQPGQQGYNVADDFG